MKRIVCLLMTAVVLFSLIGCTAPKMDSVSFYYCRKPDAYQCFKSDGVITSEDRDLTGHGDDLHYLIALYLAGPLDETLVSPFPKKTRLLTVSFNNNHVNLELTNLAGSLSDSEFSLAAACLAQTCMDFTGCGSVTIKSDIRRITITSDNVVLHDDLSQNSPKGG